MKTKYFSIFLLLVIFAQIISAFNSFKIIHSSPNENISISNLSGNDELLPNNFKLTRKINESKIEVKLCLDEGSFNPQKGNSLFDFYNQILPKTLSLTKINSSFFTVYFSTAV